MSDSKITPADIDAILKLLQTADHVGEFHLKYGDFEVRLSKHGGVPATTPAATAAPAPAETAPAPAPAPAAGSRRMSAPEGMVAVKAPMHGTFYRAPAPGAPPFVKVGDRVSPDTAVCIIEVMKLMNTIQAQAAGVVHEVLVEDSQPVDHGQVLVVIEPDRA